MMGPRLRLISALFLIALVGPGYTTWRIYRYGHHCEVVHADAALVLGAAAWGEKPSPVFRERINHAVDLYRSGYVRKIIFTGGQGSSDEPPEARVGERYAIEQGIPQADILVETASHTTRENLYYAQRVAARHQLRTFLLVSDPLHMKRAMLIAEDLGIKAFPSPTPTTMYRSPASQVAFLARETRLYLTYVLRRHLLLPTLRFYDECTRRLGRWKLGGPGALCFAGVKALPKGYLLGSRSSLFYDAARPAQALTPACCPQLHVHSLRSQICLVSRLVL
jgi:uncharacterized SAM-binding protein YcdF (DUF218 family)